MVSAHIAHDCRVGSHTIVTNNVMLAGHVTVEDRAYLSGGAAVHQYCRVGSLAMVGGQSHLTKDVPPFVTIDGLSSYVVGLNQIGLRRAGYSSETIRQLKVAYRVIYRSGLPWTEVLEQLRHNVRKVRPRLLRIPREDGARHRAGTPLAAGRHDQVPPRHRIRDPGRARTANQSRVVRVSHRGWDEVANILVRTVQATSVGPFALQLPCRRYSCFAFLFASFMCQLANKSKSNGCPLVLPLPLSRHWKRNSESLA